MPSKPSGGGGFVGVGINVHRAGVTGYAGNGGAVTELTLETFTPSALTSWNKEVDIIHDPTVPNVQFYIDDELVGTITTNVPSSHLANNYQYQLETGTTNDHSLNQAILETGEIRVAKYTS